MDPQKSTTAIGVFSSWEKAEAAIDDLIDAGFLDSEIGAVARDAEGRTTARMDRKDVEDVENVGETASAGLTGAITGVGIGGLVGLGVLSGVIPVVGPALFAGTLGVLASNAAGGAAVAGLIGALAGWGFTDDDARYYENELVSGRVIVTVHAGIRLNEARSILQSHGATTREASVSSSAAL